MEALLGGHHSHSTGVKADWELALVLMVTGYNFYLSRKTLCHKSVCLATVVPHIRRASGHNFLIKYHLFRPGEVK